MVAMAAFACGLAVLAPQEGPPITRMTDIGGWLLHEDGRVANWLGIRYQGRILQEPINVIIVDPYSTSEATAVKRLLAECKRAGYEEEYGHSAGYRAEIGGRMYRQIPNDRHMAFSNKDFFQTNNHGRIMGPALIEGRYVFVAAFSTERPAFARGLKHLFVSFTRARDDFCAKMDAKTIYKIQGPVPLGNRLDSPTTTTADHDGQATVLVASR
jgi:hypothetical protein